MNNLESYKLLLILLIFFSCSKENKRPIPTNEINLPTESFSSNYQFTVGNIDSATYYLYQPSLDLDYVQNYLGSYTETDTFDLDSDGINDIALHIDGFADGFVSGNTNYFNLTLLNLNNYEFVCDISINNNVDTLNFGDTLNSNLNWVNNTIYLLQYSSPYNQDGNWGIGFNQKYIGFRTITNDTIMGWFSLERPNLTGIALRINECAIENP